MFMHAVYVPGGGTMLLVSGCIMFLVWAGRVGLCKLRSNFKHFGGSDQAMVYAEFWIFKPTHIIRPYRLPGI